jgi:hypothetical protein
MFKLTVSLAGPLQVIVEASGRTARTDWIVLLAQSGRDEPAG